MSTLSSDLEDLQPEPGQYETIHYDCQTDSGFIIRNDSEEYPQSPYKAEEWRNGDIVDNCYPKTYEEANAWVERELAQHMEWRKSKPEPDSE